MLPRKTSNKEDAKVFMIIVRPADIGEGMGDEWEGSMREFLRIT